jgi:hypothetical protein
MRNGPISAGRQCAQDLGVFWMKVHAHFAHADGEQGESFAHGGDDFAGIGAQLAPDELFGDGDRERDQLFLDARRPAPPADARACV